MDEKLREAINNLKNIQCYRDTNNAHSLADCVLRDFLLQLGYDELIQEYDKIEKIYNQD